MAYTILISCFLLATLQVVTCLIDTSHYKILIDQKGGNFNYWNEKCKGLGDSWGIGIVETRAEANILDQFVRQEGFVKLYWLGGSTNKDRGQKVKWNQYILDLTGTNGVYIELSSGIEKVTLRSASRNNTIIRTICERTPNVVDIGLELESTTTRYKKHIAINQNNTKTYEQWVEMCTEIGYGWAAASINTKEEYSFIREGQKTFSNSYFYWMRGTTDIEQGKILDFSDYIANNSGSNGVMVSTRRTYRNDRTHERVKFNDKNVFNLKARSHDRDLDGILCEQDKNGTGETDFASATSNYRKIVGSKDVYVNYSKRCIELGDGWNSLRLESEQEYYFIQENLKTDQDQDYFAGGSHSIESVFDLFYPYHGYVPFSFQLYSPRQSERPLHMTWTQLYDYHGNETVKDLQFVETFPYENRTGIVCEKVKA